MTETSPLASTSNLTVEEKLLPQDQQADLRATVGTINFGVEVRVVEPDTTDEVPWDGETSGEIQVNGPWIAADYYNDPRSRESFTKDGWLRTGDVATIDPTGRLRLVDRTKDLIKSGGEWISSVEIENELMAHPKIREAAVIGVSHVKWSERPLACVVLEDGQSMTPQEVLDFLAPKVALVLQQASPGGVPAGGGPAQARGHCRSRPCPACNPCPRPFPCPGGRGAGGRR
jgi:fatty-acyl-CoA synthase